MKKKPIHHLLIPSILIVFVALASVIPAQAQKKQKTFRDTLDHKFDLSNYMINMHGFVPWPTIISEPSLGGFGIGMALVFVSPKKSAQKGEQFHFPDITALAGMYTLNNTWGVGALRQGTFPKIGLRYTIGAGYADIKMNFYRDFQYLGEKKFLFSIKPILAVLDVSENLYKNKIFVGFRYVYSNVKVTYTFDNLPDSVFDPASFSRNIGNLNLYAEWDSRNTIFTPDKGVRFKASYGVARPWTISDVDFEQYDVFTNIFFRPVKWWVCGFRADWQGISGDAPFYLKPYIDMRGIPAVQYQGDQVLALETELRFDVTKRWSILGFAGTGKTFSSSKYLKDETWHWAGGTGFRYLLARLFGMRMGVDVAMSQGQFAYYIVLGHYWNR